jgi:hypothetical protein
MLAYIFWHCPRDTTQIKRYEESLISFQHRLSEQPPPGFFGAHTCRITSVPWLDGRAGYEDWCYVDGSWALDSLNGFAVAGQVKAPHDAAAAQMDIGHGGLYSLVSGTHGPSNGSTVTWLTRPRGIDWRAALDTLRTEYPTAAFWRRHMVLGPAPEFAVVLPSGGQITPPKNWTALVVHGERVL